MPIAAGDIKFFRTQVMDDVSEGGGGPTGVAVPSGTSNAIFPDVSEADRAIGNVRMRKLVLGVTTDDTATLLGSNVMIAQPPDDANVDITLFSTGDMFDTRADAVARLEAYLNVGPTYPGYLYGNHIAGQNTILLYQKTDDLPPISATLVLTKREGFSNEVREYVRVTEASSELREYEDATGKFTRYVVTLKLQNPISVDLGGFDISRFDWTAEQLALKTKISDTVVADAAQYKGVKVLTEDAAIGETTIKVESPFSRLVPSAQIETPIADARTNQLNSAPVAAGSTIVQTITAVFSPTQSLFVGGGIAPGTLTIANGAVTLEDTGGRLMNGGQQVGAVDYDNGVLSLTSDAFGTGGAGANFVITYAPAGAPVAVNQAMGFDVTAENRSTSFVRTIEPAPVPGTLAISFMAQGRWYVLRDDGSGAIRGSSTAFGAGNLNYGSGTLAVTFGALPDVGSAILLTWSQPDAARDSEALTLDNDGNFYWPFNTSGAVSLEPGAKAIEPGELAISWIDPVNGAKSATDNGAGLITGDAMGTVNYARGTMRISPVVLPPPGTTINVSVASVTKVAATASMAGLNGNLGVGGVTPGSVALTVETMLRWKYLGGPVKDHGLASFLIVDDGVGGLQLAIGDARVAAGSINYGAGTFTLLANVVLPSQAMRDYLAYDNVYLAQQGTNMTWYTLTAG